MDLSDNLTGFHHYALKVHDFEATLKFYKAMGFEEVHTWSLPSFEISRAIMLFNKNINCHIELFDKNANVPTQGKLRQDGDELVETALLHICFLVKDAAQARLMALDNGATDLSQRLLELDLESSQKTVSVRNTLVYSPNGEVIEFLEATQF